MKRFAQVFATDEGEPWAAFVYGHIDPAAATPDIARAVEHSRKTGEIDELWFEEWELDPAEIKQHWIYTKDETSEDAPYYWCDADTPGATPITGVRF